MRARWSKSCVLIGYPSGEDGPIFFLFVCLFVFFYYYFICGPVLPVQDFLLWSCKKKSAFWPYNKSFIDQASLVMMLDIALILFGIFIYLNFISVHKNAMVNGQYPDLLTTRLVNNAYHIYYTLFITSLCPVLISRAIKINPPLSPTQCENFSAPMYDLDMGGPRKITKTIRKMILQTLGNKPFLKQGSLARLRKSIEVGNMCMSEWQPCLYKGT